MPVETDKKKTFFAIYNDLLIQYPLLINGIQAATIASLGVIASQLIAGVKEIDYVEVQIMAIINFIFMTPVLMWFYKLLQTLPYNVYGKLFLDQAIFSPLFTSGIISLRLYLLGSDINEIPLLVYKIVPSAMISAWLFWIPVRFIMISFIPPVLQLIVGNAFSFIWNIIFAMILAK